MEHTVTVIVCTRNRYQHVVRFLRSLAGQTRQPAQIVIVDASDDDDLPPILAALFPSSFPDMRVVRSAPGLTHQRNLGVERATGDLVFFFDDDIVLHANYLELVVSVFERDEGARYAGGMGQITGVRAAGALQYAFERIFLLGEVVGTGRFKRSGFPSLPHGHGSFMETECMSGGIACYRRSLLRKVRFDELLSDYAYMEDDDFAYRVSRGHVLFYEPAALLDHRHAESGRPNRRLIQRMLVRNHRYLHRKNFPQSLLWRCSHALSLAGLVLRRVGHADAKGLLGTLEGLFAALPALPPDDAAR